MSFYFKFHSKKESFGIDVTSTLLITDLVNLCYGYNKSCLNFDLPTLSDELLIHFIRGYFDGDEYIIGYYVKLDLKYKK